MQAGRLRQQITIQQRAIVPDATGQPVEQWSTLATVPANVRMLSGSERYTPAAGQQVARNAYRVQIRYRSDVTPLNRILHGAKVLDIEAARDPDGRQRELLCDCVELVGVAA